MLKCERAERPRSVPSWRGLLYVGLGTLAFLTSPFLEGAGWGSDGRLLWEDQVDKAGGFDAALGIAVAGERVFAAGSAANAAGIDDVLVRAYRARTGVLLWEDLVDKAGVYSRALAITAGGGRVFVAGSASNAAANDDFLV